MNEWRGAPRDGERDQRRPPPFVPQRKQKAAATSGVSVDFAARPVS